MTTTINGRMPEEIKRGLECCMCIDCPTDCPYLNCDEDCNVVLNNDAIACIKYFEEHFRDLTKKVEQLERERDAAVEDMTELMHLGKFCRHCKHLTEDGECTFDFAANKCVPWNCWQWRGVQEVE